MSRSMGCLVGIGAALLLLLGSCYALEVLLREGKGCSPPTAWEEVTGQRDADDLDSALAASAGVRTSRVEWAGTNCSASIRADAAFHRSATSDEVAAAARVIAEARRRPDAAGVSTTFTFDATGPDDAVRDGALHLDMNVPAADMAVEARAWAALSRPYPGTAVRSEGATSLGGPSRDVVVPLRDTGTPGVVTEVFRALERTPFATFPRSVSWTVRVSRETPLPSEPDETIYTAPGATPPDEVLAAMERIAGWPALPDPPGGLSVRVQQVTRPRGGEPAHLAIRVTLRLDDPRRAPGVVAEIVRDIETTGQPYALRVRTEGHPDVETRSWGP